GGDPTPHLLYILQVLKHLTSPLPQIWNSNMYCSEETMQLLHGIIDVYLTDFKFGNDTCAHRLSQCTNYSTIIQRNHLQAYNHGDLLIRHLVLPNHQHCCTEPIIDWIHQYTPDAAVNIMGQYHPAYHAHNYLDIDHQLSTDAYQKACTYAQSKQLHLL
ncbi:MAG: radical SAM protein, partial [Candidatus Thermoplasmatota archaeon]|nr:radical SAM protein [Candidatus Thermoplasmatota archaeon]